MTDVKKLLKKMRDSRRSTIDKVQNVTKEQMLGLTSYGERDVDTRFIFYRFITHEIEHTVHLAQTLEDLGIFQNEAKRILKHLQAARGELEGMLIGITDEQLDKSTGDGEWSIREIIHHILDTEDSYTHRIEETIQSASN